MLSLGSRWYREPPRHEIRLFASHSVARGKQRLQVIVGCRLPPFVAVFLFGQDFGGQGRRIFVPDGV